MPAMPPTALKRMADTENMPACHSAGTQPPIVDPTIIPIQMSFLFIGVAP
jgi:hypothetical protein